MLNFTAIDFETATSRYDSACSVAVVEVRDGVIADRWYTLIRPPKNAFLPFNISIHGITPTMVKDERDFSGVWEELKRRLEGKIVVAHNAQFDMGVLKACLATYALEAPSFKHCCTVSLSRKSWPELQNHKLNTVGEFLNIDFNHHHALDDAETCAQIPLAAAKSVGAETFEELAERLEVKIKDFVFTNDKRGGCCYDYGKRLPFAKKRQV